MCVFWRLSVSEKCCTFRRASVERQLAVRLRRPHAAAKCRGCIGRNQWRRAARGWTRGVHHPLPALLVGWRGLVRARPQSVTTWDRKVRWRGPWWSVQQAAGGRPGRRHRRRCRLRCCQGQPACAAGHGQRRGWRDQGGAAGDGCECCPHGGCFCQSWFLRGGLPLAALAMKLACAKRPSAASPPLQEFKTTALQAAVEYGFLRMVQVLIELGASVNLAHPKTGGCWRQVRCPLCTVVDECRPPLRPGDSAYNCKLHALMSVYARSGKCGVGEGAQHEHGQRSVCMRCATNPR